MPPCAAGGGIRSTPGRSPYPTGGLRAGFGPQPDAVGGTYLALVKLIFFIRSRSCKLGFADSDSIRPEHHNNEYTRPACVLTVFLPGSNSAFPILIFGPTRRLRSALARQSHTAAGGTQTLASTATAATAHLSLQKSLKRQLRSANLKR
jgi:hypothetical protein